MKKVCGIISFNSDNYWTNLKNHSIEEMPSFIDCIGASTNFPFTRIDIGTSLIKDPSHERILANFFRSVCPWVTEITIRDDWGQHLFSQGLPEKIVFTSLEVLTIHFIQTISKYEEVRSNFEFITSIMENSPALVKLVLVDHNGLDGKVVTFFLNSMEASGCKEISFLDIAGQIDDEHLIKMSKMGLRLKQLHMDFWGSMIDQNSLKAFLETQSLTLEEFKIADFAMTSSFMVEFPRMKKLKTLMVKGSVLGRICISFPNISYVNQFPVLKRLSFSNAMDEWDEFLKFGIQPVGTVEELKLPGDFSDEDSLLHAARLFPKIKKLEVSALLNIVNVVYEAMPNIEELILNTKYVDSVDDILTGLTAMECEEIRMFTDRMFQRLAEDHLNIVTTKPISSLQSKFLVIHMNYIQYNFIYIDNTCYIAVFIGLKILRLKCKRQSDPVELTDVSCRLVLMKMKTLQCLDFWGRYPPTGRVNTNKLNASNFFDTITVFNRNDFTLYRFLRTY